MKKILLVVWLFGAVKSVAQNTPAYFLSNPCLTPDGATVIFSFEGDLWKAAVADGMAVRLTAMQGYETSPRVSPDGKMDCIYRTTIWKCRCVCNAGKWRRNKTNYFTIAVNDEVTSWSWDGQTIYFNSNRMVQIAGYKVAASGGTPQRVLGNYFFSVRS